MMTGQHYLVSFMAAAASRFSTVADRSVDRSGPNITIAEQSATVWAVLAGVQRPEDNDSFRLRWWHWNQASGARDASVKDEAAD